MRPGRLALSIALVSTLRLFNSSTTLHAQTARDTLLLGRRAYERVDFDAAVRLLPVGLTAGGAASDTMWVGAVHMLTDALLEQSKDSLAQFWARWATRLAPDFAIDSTVYPPRVARALALARQAVGSSTSGDTLASTAWDEAAGAPPERGMLRIQRGGASSLAVVEGVGTMLPGEARTLQAGTYNIRITADGFAPIVIAREVLPGYTTVVTPRLIRGNAAAATTAASGAARTGADTPASNAPTLRPARIGAAGGGTCVILDNGGAACWGSNVFGQLGGGQADSTRRTPVMLGAEQNFAALAVGSTHSCALSADGHGWCWGLGTSGELGGSRSSNSPSPQPVSGGQAFVQMVSGATHTCALSAAGAAFCWGNNRNGTLGNRTNAASNTPTAIAAPANVSFTALTAGTNHTCALASNGAAYCWGGNMGGQLGNGSTSDANAPVLVQATVPFRSVTAGSVHTCALTAGGTAWCWGANSSGQLGTGSTSNDSPRPATVMGDLSFASLAAGDAHTCGLTADGAAYCWGAGRTGQLGNGQTSDSPRPVLVVGGHVFRALALGTSHSCGLADDGTTWCWGGNGDGQLGGLGGRGSSTPVPVVIRPAPRAPAANAPAMLRETFNDGNFTANPAWAIDSAPGLRVSVADTALEVARAGSRGQAAAAGVTIPVHIAVTRSTQIQFDVQLRGGQPSCGLNCASYPAVVRVRVKNSDLTESEVWYAFGDHGGRSRTLGSVVIVAKGDTPANTWLREQRFTIRDALPRADTILQVSLGGVGTDFAARFDNIMLPVPVASALDVTPDSVRLTSAGARAPLRAAVRESGGAEMPGARVRWTSADTAVARVDSLGVVTAVATGRTVVRAAVGTVMDSARVNVQLPAARRGGGRRNR